MTTPSRLFLLLAILVSPFASRAADVHPNILWITSEDHGQHMGCYGDKVARTPNVDALAAKGMIFKTAWSVAPVCAAARTAIISGLYPSSLGGIHMRSMVSLPAELRMYPQFLREAGYYCTNNSKTDYNLREPGKVWDESSGKAHWKNRPAGQPFFAIFNSVKSHESQIRSHPRKAVVNPADIRVPAYHPDTPEVRRDWARYYDIVSEADADAGQLLRELEEAGLSADTIVFYYGDHGSGMPRSKRWPSDSGLRVPMVVYFPEKWKSLAPAEYAAGGKSDRLVGFVDLAPTLLSIAGVRPPATMQGHAFAGPHQTRPMPYLFGERGRMDERSDLVRSVTDGRFVYLWNFLPHLSQGQHVRTQFETATTAVWWKLYGEGKTNEAQSLFWKTPRATEELYDLQTDPDEVRNLAGSPEHQEILSRFRQAQHEHALAIRDVCLLPEAEMVARTGTGSPYGLGHDDTRLPLTRILSAAEVASDLPKASLAELGGFLADPERAVRYWGAMGHLMRGREAVAAHEAELVKALADVSPDVRIAAAQALGLYGSDGNRAAALRVLGELVTPAENGALVSLAALGAVEALGDKAASLREKVRAMPKVGPSPDKRYTGYVERLAENVAPPAGGQETDKKPKAKKDR